MRKNLISILTFAVSCSMSLLLLQGCGGGSSSSSTAAGSSITYTASSKSSTYSGSVPAVYHIDSTGYVNLDYTLNLGSSTKNVYFVFTNTSLSSDSYSAPSVSSSSSLSTTLSSLYSSDTISSSFEDNSPKIITPAEVTAFNRNAMKDFSAAANYGMANYSISAANSSTAVADTNIFYYTSTASNTVSSTCRGVYSNTTTGITLNIWVANDCWTSTGTKTVKITQAMVDALGTQFMGTSGTGNIYSWITSIFGAPWGTTAYSNLIASTAASSIDILLCDVNTLVGNDPAASGGVVLGFFYSKDNYLKKTYAYSNERLMFYLDALSLASSSASKSGYNTASSDTWGLTSSYWPCLALSTLGHEFQHMIHFYQKNVVYNVSSDTWLNEMCSMAAEDFIADKLGINAPSTTRIPYYNAYDYYSLTSWNDNSPLPNYGLSYSFGSYLSRNFGGVNVFNKIVQNKFGDYQAVVQALTDLSYSETFSSLLQKWGAAVLLSSSTSAPSAYVYNTGSTFTSTINSISYTCASINLFSFSTTPKIYTSSSASSMTATKYSGNQFYSAGAVTGTNTFKIKLNDGVKLTVVVK